MAYPKMNLTGDYERILLKQVIILMYTAEKRILDRDDPVLNVTVPHGGKYVLKRIVWHRFGVRAERQNSLFAVCPCFSLEGYFHARRGH